MWKQSIKESVKAAGKLLPGQKQILNYYADYPEVNQTTTINRKRLKQHQKEVKREEENKKSQSSNNISKQNEECDQQTE